MERRKCRREPRPTPRQPQSTCSPAPWNPFSRKAGFSPSRPPPAHSTMSWSSPPRPGSRRSLPPRSAAAEESCPKGSGCGKRVLAALYVRREWSCCKMAAEAHAAGSKPDPVPLASERAPGARARPRVTPPFPPLPRASASLTPSAPALLQLLLHPLPPLPASVRPLLSAFLLPFLAPLSHRFHSRLRPLRHEWPPFLSSFALSLTPSFALSRPRPPVPAESAPLFLSPALT